MIDEKNPHNLYYLKHDYKKLKAYTFYYVNFHYNLLTLLSANVGLRFFLNFLDPQSEIFDYLFEIFGFF